MRRIASFIASCTFSIISGFALADESVAGYWLADLGDGVRIEMNVSPDGQWNSQTMRDGVSIAEMAGKYSQRVRSASTGILVFVPTQSHVTSQHGAPTVEHDTYVLSDDGEVLSLTAKGDVLVFHKLTR